MNPNSEKSTTWQPTNSFVGLRSALMKEVNRFNGLMGGVSFALPCFDCGVFQIAQVPDRETDKSVAGGLLS